jgi:hypothetical protein
VTLRGACGSLAACAMPGSLAGSARPGLAAGLLACVVLLVVAGLVVAVGFVARLGC